MVVFIVLAELIVVNNSYDNDRCLFSIGTGKQIDDVSVLTRFCYSLFKTNCRLTLFPNARWSDFQKKNHGPIGVIQQEVTNELAQPAGGKLSWWISEWKNRLDALNFTLCRTFVKSSYIETYLQEHCTGNPSESVLYKRNNLLCVEVLFRFKNK